MGVYIKGQEMPETCNDCEFLDLDTFDYEMHTACGLTGEIVTYDLRHGRNENCPLVSVTEPHGRLIDVDEHFREIKSHWCAGCVNYPKGCVFCKVTVYEDMMDAPTVIEAEGE